MSAILSADDLNDFISPSVACIKPVETLPTNGAQQEGANPYEVTTEDAAQAANAPPAQISLTDCLACSGCVTSAEAVLVSLQSYQEVLTTLDAYPEIPIPQKEEDGALRDEAWKRARETDGKIFVASVSPQAKASLAATFGVSERAAGNMIQQLLSGEQGLRQGGNNRSGFAWVLGTDRTRDIALVAAAEEVKSAIPRDQGESDFTRRDSRPQKPVLTSACPGWICYAEKTHPHVLPHISKLKSPQALTGTLLKSVLSRKYGISPDKVWHMAIMPCFDKKLEASREELMDSYWTESSDPARDQRPDPSTTGSRGVRDVDLVITSRELISLATARGISFNALPRHPIPRSQLPAFPDLNINDFLFPPTRRNKSSSDPSAGTSGGYLYHILQTVHALHPGSTISTQRGRNIDVVEYSVLDQTAIPIFRAARYYGFRNISTLR